ncbi:MAG: hypothetical protein Q9167_006617 [Letrouitia subvulpina]
MSTRDTNDDPVLEPRKQDRSSEPSRWTRFFRASSRARATASEASSERDGDVKAKPEKWALGILNDRETDEVPGSVLLMSNAKRNEPLGLRNTPARTSASSLPSPFPPSSRPPMTRHESEVSTSDVKKTRNGAIILNPQPDDSMNDPLNWPSLRRDAALLSLGFYCMVGGGMTPILAAGFSDVAKTYNVSVPQVALTTGFYMLGLGLGCVVTSPTAILFGKRPVYLFCILLFIISSIWCAASPNYPSLVVARIFMGMAVSPVEALPSATIAEIFFLHERAYRLGIYTLLLLSGKNLVPLVSAAIIQGLHSWRWVFWIVAIVVGFCFVLMFLFVPETFWDRTPRPHTQSRKPKFKSISGFFHQTPHEKKSMSSLAGHGASENEKLDVVDASMIATTIAERRQQKSTQHHVGFADNIPTEEKEQNSAAEANDKTESTLGPPRLQIPSEPIDSGTDEHRKPTPYPVDSRIQTEQDLEAASRLGQRDPSPAAIETGSTMSVPVTATMSEKQSTPGVQPYTSYLRNQPAKTFAQTLRPWNGRLRHENWLKVAIRPFVLFAFPSILWSSLVYSLSIGWLIVLSESVSEIYRSEDYHFSALGVGLVYISPFIGGVLGTAVAGKVSDVIVRLMSRRNGGVYEPEFRLVMAIPITISTCIGLMGFGWSAEEKDSWIVPTVFFGIISFGSSLGSTTSITFAVVSSA